MWCFTFCKKGLMSGGKKEIIDFKILKYPTICYIKYMFYGVVVDFLYTVDIKEIRHN